jgi:hypothetical protein
MHINPCGDHRSQTCTQRHSLLRNTQRPSLNQHAPSDHRSTNLHPATIAQTNMHPATIAQTNCPHSTHDQRDSLHTMTHDMDPSETRLTQKRNRHACSRCITLVFLLFATIRTIPSSIFQQHLSCQPVHENLLIGSVQLL